MNTEFTDPHRTHQSKWSDSYHRPINAKSMSQVDQYRFALAEYMHQQELHGCHLFHLTLTYKPFGDRVYTESDANSFFINFYVRHFLPYLLNTRNIHTNAKKLIQPICLAFLDEHETDPQFTSIGDYFNTEFPIRLHHHAILAVHPDTVNRLHGLIGANKFANSNFSHKIMTSHLRECEARTLRYASKMLSKYPDFLSFPDKFHREHHKYTAYQ